MAFQEKQLGQSQLTGSGTQDTVYTAPASTTAIIRDIQIANVNATAKRVKVWLVSSGGSPDDTNIIIPNMTIDGNDIIHWSGFQVLTAGDTIQAEASAASSICITVSGAEVS